MLHLLQFNKKPIYTGPIVFVCGMSRSGTTLLCTILDSHTNISMGYELISPPINSVAKLKSTLKKALEESGGNLPKAGKAIQKAGEKETGKFIARCHRAGIYTKDLVSILEELDKKNIHNLTFMKTRLTLASLIVQKAMLKKKADFCGFKYSSASYELGRRLFPGALFIFIARNPKDVAASHIERKFGHTIPRICKAWIHNVDRFLKFNNRHPEISRIIRYEDLVSKPQETFNKIFEIIPLEIEENLINFQNSNASIYKSSHPNTSKLKQGFFTSSIGRWEKDLSRQNSELIVRYCKKYMPQLGYSET